MFLSYLNVSMVKNIVLTMEPLFIDVIFTELLFLFKIS